MDNIQTIIAVIFMISGIIGMLAPSAMAKFLGLKIESLQGKIEVQAVYGGITFGLGLGALLVGSQDAFNVLGFALISMAISRILSLMAAKAPIEANTITLLMFIELIGGLLLLLE